MPSFLDLDGLRSYDEKMKGYVNEKIRGVKTTSADGVSIVADESGVMSLNADYIAYLDQQTYKAPAISKFSITGVSGSSAEVGTSYSPTAFTHNESNVSNIDGSLTLKKGSTVVRSGIAASASSVTLDFTDTEKTAMAHKFTSASSVTWTLSGKNSKGSAFSKTVTVNAYYPAFVGTSTKESVEGSDILGFSKYSSIKGTRNVTVAEASYIYLCCQSSTTVTKVTSGGFESAFNLIGTVTVDINGVNSTYNVYRTPDPISADTYELVIS